jgi:undecaprenyl-diphosphatase
MVVMIIFNSFLAQERATLLKIFFAINILNMTTSLPRIILAFLPEQDQRHRMNKPRKTITLQPLFSFSQHLLKNWLKLGLGILLISFFINLSWELHDLTGWEGKRMDEFILTQVSHHRVANWNGAAVDLTALGSTTLITFFTLIFLIFFALLRNWLSFLHLALASLGSGLLSFVFKNHFMRPRPDIVIPLVEVTSYSYPSGHSLAAASFYLSLTIIGCRYVSSGIKRTILFCISSILIISVGLSRIYLGVHYPSDVLGGLTLGCAWALILAYLVETFEKYSLQKS